MRTIVLAALAVGAAAAAAATTYETDFAATASSEHWPDVYPGAMASVSFTRAPWSAASGCRFWLRAGNASVFGFREAAGYDIPLVGTNSIVLGAGAWFDLAQNPHQFYIPEDPDPDRNVAWFTEVRPFVAVAAAFRFSRVTVAPACALQFGAYRNFRRDEPDYYYVEPSLASFLKLTPRWSLGAAGYYWRGLNNDWANVGFFGLGPSFSF